VVEMLLLDGISGFHVHDLPEVDSSHFKQLCYSIATFKHGRIVTIENSHNSQNFYKAKLEMSDESIFILLNSSYPIVAFASSVEFFNIQFIDPLDSSVIEAFSYAFKIATANELVERLVIDERTQTVLNKNNLNKSELSQIFFWKPKTVGDIVFNFWD
jgi:hypothetical protein